MSGHRSRKPCGVQGAVGEDSFVTSLTPTSETLPPFMSSIHPASTPVGAPRPPTTLSPKDLLLLGGGQCHPTVVPSGSAVHPPLPPTTPSLPLLLAAPAPSLDAPSSASAHLWEGGRSEISVRGPSHQQPDSFALSLLALPRPSSSITFLCLSFLTCKLGIIVHTCRTVRRSEMS